MKKNIFRMLAATITMMGCAAATNILAYAEENTDESTAVPGTSISITPVSNVVSLTAGNTYDYSFNVTNSGSEEMNFEVYAAPYSYTLSENDNEYKLGFSHENNYTQITRWITVKDTSGNYVEKPKFVAAPGETVEVFYRIQTPESIPAGGQYAVLFAHTLSGSISASGIKTEASPGLVIYGRGAGDTIRTAEISNPTILKNITSSDGSSKTQINASAKVKNTGNVDFTVSGKLTVQSVFGRSYYESDPTTTVVSVIPETELSIADKWEETPFFGLFRVAWKVTAADKTEETTSVILIMPISMIIGLVILLTIIVVWIIIMVRKRKERRSRLAV